MRQCRQGTSSKNQGPATNCSEKVPDNFFRILFMLIFGQSHDSGGISKEDFFKYFEGTNDAYAIKIKKRGEISRTD